MAERSNGKKSTSGDDPGPDGRGGAGPAARRAQSRRAGRRRHSPPPETGGALFGGDEVDLDARHPADVPVGNFPAPSQIAQVARRRQTRSAKTTRSRTP